ncbi:MAG: M48 family metallopeptidase [Chloroflexi bacterium]|nr:M48 family metallopeptidase [Chloroflexota bacterium]
MTLLGGRQSVQFGTTTIDYELTYSERKTLAIHVYPDGSVVVDAPMGSSFEAVEAKVKKRGGWILRQQRQFETYAAPNPLQKQYVSGESYRYLGRQYRLKVMADAVERVSLSRGYLTVSVQDTADKAHIQKLITAWYRQQAKRVFAERLKVCYPRVEPYGLTYPEVSIRQMKARWGSCTADGKIILNLILIHVPKHLIDYVILHELCHLKEHNHGTAFYGLLARVLPDWEAQRRQLNQAELR